MNVARQYVAVRHESTDQSQEKFVKKPRDEQIKLPMVQLVDPITSKLLSPEPPSDILSRIKRSTHYVELVSQDPPLVKIIDRKEAAAERKASKAKLKQSKMEQKELQLSWKSEPSDIEHKLKKARAILGDGDMVNIAFARKARQRPPPVEEMQERLKQVVASLSDIAIEKKPMVVERGVGIVYLRPKSGKAANVDVD